jgi:hypothetical protein
MCSISLVFISLGCTPTSLILHSIGRSIPTKYSRINVLENSKNTKRGKIVDGIWMDKEAISTIKNAGIAVDRIVTAYIDDQDGISKDLCKTYLEQTINSEYYKSGIFTKDTNSANCKMTFVFTNLSTGDANERAYLDAGHAFVEIQAIIRKPDGSRILEIRDLRKSSGLSWTSSAFATDAADLIKPLTEKVAINILDELKFILKKDS